jgi:hypothetical protein
MDTLCWRNMTASKQTMCCEALWPWTLYAGGTWLLPSRLCAVRLCGHGHFVLAEHGCFQAGHLAVLMEKPLPTHYKTAARHFALCHITRPSSPYMRPDIPSTLLARLMLFLIIYYLSVRLEWKQVHYYCGHLLTYCAVLNDR